MRGVAGSGGGFTGNFTVGVVHTLAKDFGVRWDAMAGCSVAAGIFGFLAQYTQSMQERGVEDLKYLFSKTTTDGVWKNWIPFRMLHGFWKSSFYNNSPYRELVREIISPQRLLDSGVELRIPTVSLTSGKYEMFSQEHPDIVSAIIASGSVPGLFPPVQIGTEQYTDGGVRKFTPIKALIEAGCTEIDVIISHPRAPVLPFDETPNALQVSLRAISMMSEEIIWRDLKTAQMYNKLVEAGLQEGKRVVKLNVYHPPKVLLTNALKADAVDISRMMVEGEVAVGRAYRERSDKS